MAYDAVAKYAKKTAPESKNEGIKSEFKGDDIIAKKAETFISNNWLKTDKNTILNAVNEHGGALWMLNDGDLAYRFNKDERPIKNTVAKTESVLSNFLNLPVKFKGDDRNVAQTALKLVHEDVFNPFVKEEFINKGHFFQRNTFKPTQYMGLSGQPKGQPKAILSLIGNLTNGNEEYFKWVINWLALFFQTLTRSQVSLVLRGTQGTGKGILFENILKPLFGMEQCIAVNDKSLEGNFIGGIIEGRLFFNIDEVSHNIASSKKVKNFLKALVTNNGIIVEKKFVNTEKETPLYGQILITSNEPYVLEVEHGDRRYTILQTGGTLKECNFLGYGNFHGLAKAIEAELEDFARYLMCYKSDEKLFNTALDTPEKRALVRGTQDKFQTLVHAIKTKDLLFFEDIINSNSMIFNELKEDFAKGRVCKEELRHYYHHLFDDEISGKRLMERLRVIDPLFFDEKNIKKSNGKNYFCIECLNLGVM